MADKGGLEGVVVARSRLCSIDGQRGRPDLRRLRRQRPRRARLLRGGRLPDPARRLPLRDELDRFAAELRPARTLSDETGRGDRHAGRPRGADGDAAHAVSADSFDDPDKASNDEDANVRKATRADRRDADDGRALRPPARAARSRSTPTRRSATPRTSSTCCRGERRGADASRTFDVALILHADHEMNASTFTARVIASTLSDMHSAITGAIGALKGPLHGGANEQVMKLLECDRRPRAGRGRDPRAPRAQGTDHGLRPPRLQDVRPARRDPQAVLGAAGRRSPDEPQWYDMSERIETVVLDEKGLYPNVDFYSASHLPLPGHRDGPVHADLRDEPRVGWAAHVIEQHLDNRLIRPSSEYIGPPLRSYLPVEQRTAPEAA